MIRQERSLARLSAAIFVVLLMFAGVTLAAAQTETTLYDFTMFTGDGNYPHAGVVADSAGALYGTTILGGHGSGAVYKLTPPATPGGSWTEAVIYSFQNTDGELSYSNLLINKVTGRLYGTTAGGGTSAQGVVYQLTPPAQVGGAWTEAVLHNFTALGDGGSLYGGLIADKQGRIYGTTEWGGQHSSGLVFRLLPPSQSGGAWTEQRLYSFKGGNDGERPLSSLIFDSAGALYGTTYGGGPKQGGTIFKLTPPASGVGPWSESVLYTFTGGSDGGRPYDSLIFDSAGALYGTTSEGGGTPQCYHGCGTVFQLTPPSAAGGAWTENVLYAFTGSRDSFKPAASLIFDNTGALYGTTLNGGENGGGEVFKLTPPAGGQGPWTKTAFWAFSNTGGGPSTPICSLLLLGNTFYGTTSGGGSSSVGAVFSITP